MTPSPPATPAIAGLSDLIDMTDEIRGALATGAPVVALESTIITHGMPYPQNVETARAVEADIRATGALPATIAIMEGRIRVGLEDPSLEELAKAKGVMKLSRADLAYAVAGGLTGSTTVAATMMAAELAGIEVFATGGIGGVHKGAEISFDISADLGELGRSNVIVVCAGAKAILDIPKTLEVLETQGVAVIGYGTDEFPAFWSRESGCKAPLRADEAEQIAQLWRTRRAMGQAGGLLIANPVPEADEIPADEINRHIETAICEADTKGISGKDVTPFLLGRLVELTKGRSLATNIALIRNNARLAAEVAVELAS